MDWDCELKSRAVSGAGVLVLLFWFFLDLLLLAVEFRNLVLGWRWLRWLGLVFLCLGVVFWKAVGAGFENVVLGLAWLLCLGSF